MLANTTQIFPEDRGTNYAVREGDEAARRCWTGCREPSRPASPKHKFGLPPWRIGQRLPILGGMTSPDSNWLSRALGRHPRVRTRTTSTHCAACGKDYVNPVDWEPVTPEAWWMRLRCGECHVWREVTVTNKVAERFDIELDRRADLIHRALAKLDRERMVQQVETMIGALRHGLIEPADFAVAPRSPDSRSRAARPPGRARARSGA